MLWRYQIIDILSLVSIHSSMVCVFSYIYRFVPSRSAIYECGKLRLLCHVFYRYPPIFCVYLCILSIASCRTDVAIIGRLHKTHLNRRNLVAGDAALTDTCDLHGIVDAVERCTVVDELREVALMEHCTDVRLQAA